MPTPTSRQPLRPERSGALDLDLPAYLPAEEGDPRAAIAAIRDGLPSDAFDWLRHELGLTVGELADVVHIARRTVSRRKKEGHLKPDESERVLRLIRIYRRAAEVLGGADEARQWMREPNFALGDATPLRFADTEPGARRVEQLLGQIEHGVVT
jgi:putative toxin-antitoxin system antitoxin component (TIGR02293 family)